MTRQYTLGRYVGGPERQYVNFRKYKQDVLQFESVSPKIVMTNRDGVELNPRLYHASDGLCTEVGEFKDSLKKRMWYGAAEDRANLIEELGDILWYLTLACDVLHASLAEVMEANYEKLAERYRRRQFDAQNAKVRNLERERQALEGVIGGVDPDAETGAGSGDSLDEVPRPVRDGTCG